MFSESGPGEREDLAERVWEVFDRPSEHPAASREEAELGVAYVHCLQEVQRCAELLAAGDMRGLRDAAGDLCEVASELAESGVRDLVDDPDPDSRRVAQVAAYWGADHAASRRLVDPWPDSSEDPPA